MSKVYYSLCFIDFEKALLNEILRGCPHGVMVRALDSGIVVSEFELQSRYYVPLGKV